MYIRFLAFKRFLQRGQRASVGAPQQHPNGPGLPVCCLSPVTSYTLSQKKGWLWPWPPQPLLRPETLSLGGCTPNEPGGKDMLTTALGRARNATLVPPLTG